MKTLGNLKHNGVQYRPGQALNFRVVTASELAEIMASATAGLDHTKFPVPAERLAVLHDVITQAQLDQLIANGVVTEDDNAPLPSYLPLKWRNLAIQDNDAEREKASKSEQAATRAENVASNIAPPQAGESQIIKGDAADAAAAIAKSDAAAAAARLDITAVAPVAPTVPVAPTAPVAPVVG